MGVSVLIVTPSQGFGELIQQTLENETGYYPVLATSREEALAHASETTFALAILDSDLTEVPLNELGRELQGLNSGLHLIFIPPENSAPSGSPTNPAPEGYLSKPFYLPDLLKMIREILDGQASVRSEPASQLENSPGETAQFPWLQDVTRAAQHLTRLSLEVDARAALITRHRDLWAYAGQFAQPAARELSQVVIQGWRGDREVANASDLVRFVRLVATQGEYMLYATSLGNDMVLALAFDAETPFSRIRSQAGHLARALSLPPEQEVLHPEGVSPSRQTPAGRAARLAQIQDFDDDDEFDETDLDDMDEAIPLEPLFPPDSVPPPTPRDDAFARTQAERTNPNPRSPGSNPIPDDSSEPTGSSALDDAEAFPDIAEVDEGTLLHNEDLFSGDDIHTPLAGIPQPGNERNETTRELTPATDRSLRPLQLKPISLSIYNLNYACMLVTRLPQHQLVGSLNASLVEWVQQLSLAFGWHLEFLDVQPEYLLWISSVTPSTSPDFLIKAIRRHTSRRIFSEYPVLARENPSGDFWATGYMVITASQPPPEDILNGFVEHTRRSQGITGNG